MSHAQSQPPLSAGVDLGGADRGASWCQYLHETVYVQLAEHVEDST